MQVLKHCNGVKMIEWRSSSPAEDNPSAALCMNQLGQGTELLWESLPRAHLAAGQASREP